jgi:hypothetical protein
LWGIGVKKDADLANQLTHDAAVRGSGLASAYLGDMFYIGIGVPSELLPERLTEFENQAFAWVRKHPLTLQFQYKDTVGSKDFPIFALSAVRSSTHVGQLIPIPSGKDKP